jgi:hypothetical protein
VLALQAVHLQAQPPLPVRCLREKKDKCFDCVPGRGKPTTRLAQAATVSLTSLSLKLSTVSLLSHSLKLPLSLS